MSKLGSAERGLGLACVVTLAGTFGAGETQAQEMLSAWTNQRSGSAAEDDLFGAHVARLGDINADGIIDFFISAIDEDNDVAPYDHCCFGTGRVVSGADGAILRKHLGPEEAGFYGMSIAAGSDLDGDQIADYAISSPYLPNVMTGPSEGVVDVYSGATGALLFQLTGERDGDAFGAMTRFVGDVDADGVDDLGVGAPWIDGGRNLPQVGGVYIHSGRTGAVLYKVTGTKANEFMGKVNGLGDINGDGHADFAIGSNGFNAGPNTEGKVGVYSGATGAKLYTLVGEDPGDKFGDNLCPLGDVNGDGAPDFAVNSPVHGLVGRIYVYSAPTGKLLYTIDGVYTQQQFGYLPARGPTDFNGDGFDDVIVGTIYVATYPNNESKIQIHDGRTGRLVHEIWGESLPSGFTEGLVQSDACGDFDGDGIDDIIAGAADWNASDGRAYVFAGNDLFLQVRPTDAAVGDIVTADLRGGPPGLLGLLALVDVSGTPTFETLLLAPFDSHGEMQLSAQMPPSASGLDFTVIGYSQNRAGRGPLMDSLRVTVTVK